MSETSELVERLRAVTCCRGYESYCENMDAAKAAADMIERLEADNESLRGSLAEWRADFDSLRALLASAEKAAETFKQSNTNCTNAYAELQAQLASEHDRADLREALGLLEDYRFAYELGHKVPDSTERAADALLAKYPSGVRL